MGLEIKDKDTSSQLTTEDVVLEPVAPVVEAPKIRLVLAGGIKRYNRAGALFSDQKIYSCTQAQALEMLAWEIDEQPVFKRFKAVRPKRNETQDDVEQPASAPREVSLSNEHGAAQALTSPARRIDVGSPEEEAELFGDLDKDDGVEV